MTASYISPSSSGSWRIFPILNKIRRLAASKVQILSMSKILLKILKLNWRCKVKLCTCCPLKKISWAYSNQLPLGNILVGLWTRSFGHYDTDAKKFDIVQHCCEYNGSELKNHRIELEVNQTKNLITWLIIIIQHECGSIVWFSITCSMVAY